MNIAKEPQTSINESNSVSILKLRLQENGLIKCYFGEGEKTPNTDGFIDSLAKEVTLRFNAGLQKPTELMLLEKQQKVVQRAINGFLSAIAKGVVTSSTKDKLVELEEKSAKLQKKINAQMQKDTTPLSEEKIKAFLTHFAKNKYDGEEAMSEFFNSFIYRVFEDCVYIFYNTSHDMPNKLRLEKNELADLKKFRSHRKSTLEPFVFKWLPLAER